MSKTAIGAPEVDADTDAYLRQHGIDLTDAAAAATPVIHAAEGDDVGGAGKARRRPRLFRRSERRKARRQEKRRREEKPPWKQATPTSGLATEEDRNEDRIGPFLQFVLVIALIIFLGVGGLAFRLMFQTVVNLLNPHFQGGWAWVVPACTEGGYFGLTLVGYVFERIKKPMWVLRPVSALFAAMSLWLNVLAGNGDKAAIVGHAAPVVLFVTIAEILRHAVRKHARSTTDVRVYWWLMRPGSASHIFRAMRVHGLTYEVALAREDARLYVVSLLRAVKGRRWRSEVPRLLRYQVCSGRLPARVVEAVDAAVEAGSDSAWEAAVHSYIVRELRRPLQLQEELDRSSGSGQGGNEGDTGGSNRGGIAGSNQPDGGSNKGGAGGSNEGGGGSSDDGSGASVGGSNRGANGGRNRGDGSGGDRSTGGGERSGRGLTDRELMPYVRRIAAAHAEQNGGKAISAAALKDRLASEHDIRIARWPRAGALLEALEAESASAGGPEKRAGALVSLPGGENSDRQSAAGG